MVTPTFRFAALCRDIPLVAGYLCSAPQLHICCKTHQAILRIQVSEQPFGQ